jgi:hypothetical protein
MPIRFRCAYCNQLMGIARRKAGTVVHCPKCKGQVVVPTPDGPLPNEESSPIPIQAHDGGRDNGGAGGGVFERSDFEKLFEPAPQGPQILHQATLPAPPPAHAGAVLPAAVSVDLAPLSPPKRGILLSPPILALVCGLVVILMGLAFFLGLLLGRSGSGA